MPNKKMQIMAGRNDEHAPGNDQSGPTDNTETGESLQFEKPASKATKLANKKEDFYEQQIP